MSSQQRFLAYCLIGIAIGAIWWEVGTAAVQQGWQGGSIFAAFGPVLIALSVFALGLYFISRKE